MMPLKRAAATYVQFGKVCEDLREAVVVVLLGELDLAHVEVPDAVDLVVLVHHRGRLPLGLRESDVDEVLSGEGEKEQLSEGAVSHTQVHTHTHVHTHTRLALQWQLSEGAVSERLKTPDMLVWTQTHPEPDMLV